MNKFTKNEDGSVTYNQVRVYKTTNRAFAIDTTTGTMHTDTRDQAFRWIDRTLTWHAEAVEFLAANPNQPEPTALARAWEKAQAEFSEAGQKMNTSYGSWCNLSYDVTQQKLNDAKDHIAFVIANAQAVEVARQKIEALMETTAEAEFNEWRSNTYRWNDAQRHQTLTLQLVK